MALFKKSEETQAFLKMGIYGSTGSGKTYTATKIAIGLAKHIEKRTGVKPPLMFLDTEQGSDWMRPMVEQADLEFLGAKTRAFADLKTAVREAEAQRAVMLVDSITHFWEDLKLAFARKRQRKYDKLEFQDYGPIKQQWGEFTQSFLTSNAHIILLGRAGNTYEYQDKEDEDTGKTKKELISTGTKMKAETEMGYEPSLLVEMVSIKDPADRSKKQIQRIAHVIKDRADLLDGKSFIDPTFQNFMPHIERLNIGGEQSKFEQQRDTSQLFDPSGRTAGQEWRLQKDIVLEEIEQLLLLHYPGQSVEEKRIKAAMIRKHFGGVWKELEEVFTVEKIRAGFDALHQELERKASRYHIEQLDDEIPDSWDSTGKPLPNDAVASPAAATHSESIGEPQQDFSIPDYGSMDDGQLLAKVDEYYLVLSSLPAENATAVLRFLRKIDVDTMLKSLRERSFNDAADQITRLITKQAAA